MNNIFKKYGTVIIAGVFFILAYLPIIFWMWDRWFARDSYYSHGILVPFVSGFLIWQMRGKLKDLIQPSIKRGMILIVLGILIHIVAILFRVYFVSGFSMYLVLIGLILYFAGWKVLKVIWFPVVFLFFMFPLPLVIITNISFRMKMMAAKIAAFTLNHIGIPALREGSMIYMRHAYVVVDDVCSGLRSLVSLLALGSIFAYMLKLSALKKWIVFLSTVPIAVLTNVCRVVFLSAVSEIWGAQYAKGFVHDASGMLIFVLAFLMLLAVGRLLE